MKRPSVQDVEPQPEADRLDGLPHPRNTLQVFGQDQAARELFDSFARGRMHHGWLLAGARGIGKATLAYKFAAVALSGLGSSDDWQQQLMGREESLAAGQVRALSHPGLLVIRRPYDQRAKRFSATIPVDEVRRIRNFFAHRAGGSAWRVVIVDQADELNINAANALLKSLEEPPERTIFLLITSEPGRLLPTIRSRCRTLALAPLAREPLRQAAEAALDAGGHDQPAAEDWAVLEQLACGSVGRLLSLALGDGLSVHAQLTSLMGTLPKLDWVMAHGIADELAPAAAEQKFETFFELFLDALAADIRTRLETKDGLAGRVDLWETIIRDKAQAKALNLDRKALILQTFAQLEAVAERAA